MFSRAFTATSAAEHRLHLNGARYGLLGAGYNSSSHIVLVSAWSINESSVEGGDKTVKGIVISETAVLVVTSGRNDAVVMGTATLQGGALHWQALEEIRAGEPEGDSPLILEKGVLTRKRP